MKFLLKPIIKFPFITIVIVLLITGYLGYNIKNLKVDNDVNSMIPDDHPVKVAQREIEEEFGTAEMVMVGLITDNIFQQDFLKKVKNLTKSLKKLKIESDPFEDSETGEEKTKQKKCIEDVMSLSTVPFVEGTEFGMKVSKLMKKVPKNDEQMAALKKKIFSWDVYEGMLVSSDSKATLIAIEYKRTLSYEERMRMVDAVRTTVDETGFGDGVELYIAGIPFVTSMISKNMVGDISKLLPAVFLIVICFLWFTMRRLSSVVLIFVTIGISVIWTMGLMAVLGFTVALISSSIPILLVAIGSAYSIHIINHYNDEIAEGSDAVTAVENSINIVGISVFAAAVTTMSGFMSLMTSSLGPIKEFGLFTGVGTGVSFIVSVIFVPALLVAFDKIKKTGNKKQKDIDKKGIDLVPFLQMSIQRVIKHSKLVITISILFLLAAFLVTFRIYSDMNPIKNFKKNTEIRKAEDLLNEKFMGMTTLVITVEADEDNYFKNPEPLKKLDEFKTLLEENPKVGRVDAISEYIKRMNYAMNANQKEYERVPETREQIAQYLLLYSNPDDLTGVVTTDFRKVRMIVFIKDGSVNIVTKLNEVCSEWLTTNFPGLKVKLGGETQIAVATNELVVQGQIYSLISSVITVFFISTIIFRSLMGGFLAIIPLTISVMMNFAILGITGIPLDVGTALIACIGIGIGVDYSIHYINGVKHGMITSKGLLHNACNEGIKITGNAIVFNAISVAFGFLILIFSSFVPLIKLGGFVAFTMITASIGTLFLLPACITTFKPKFLKK